MADYGTVIETGSCGNNVTYAIYDSGTCVLSGSGATYDYAYPNYETSENPASPISDRYNALGLKEIIFESGITSIGKNLCAMNRDLESVEFSETIEKIGQSAFGVCGSLTELTFPKSLKNLQALFLCDTSTNNNIKSLTFTGNAPIFVSNTFTCIADGLICYYPSMRSGWSAFSFGDYGASGTVTWVAYSTSALYRYGIQITPKGGHALQLRKPKLEIGTVATDWSPAPEDPNEKLYEMISVLQTDFSVVQGQIQAKIWETDIEKATNGLYESITEMYSYINETVNSITAEVGNLTYDIKSLTAQVSTLVITSDEITSRVLQVEQTMATTSYVISQIDQLSDSITATVASINDDIGMLYSQFEMLPDTIKLTVGSTSNGSASIIMTVNGQESGGSLYSNGLRDAFAKDASAITISAGTITFNSNTFIVNSTYFSVTAAGVITATSGLIGGWTINSSGLSSSYANINPSSLSYGSNFSVSSTGALTAKSGTIGGWTISSTALYSGPSSISDETTQGIIMYAGTSGAVRTNYNSHSALLRYGYLTFDRNSSEVAYISGNSYYSTTGVFGLRLAGYGIIATIAPYLLSCTKYYAHDADATGYIGYTGTKQMVTSVNFSAGSYSYDTLYFYNGILNG